MAVMFGDVFICFYECFSSGCQWFVSGILCFWWEFGDCLVVFDGFSPITSSKTGQKPKESGLSLEPKPKKKQGKNHKTKKHQNNPSKTHPKKPPKKLAVQKNIPVSEARGQCGAPIRHGLGPGDVGHRNDEQGVHGEDDGNQSEDPT